MLCYVPATNNDDVPTFKYGMSGRTYWQNIDLAGEDLEILIDRNGEWRVER